MQCLALGRCIGDGLCANDAVLGSVVTAVCLVEAKQLDDLFYKMNEHTHLKVTFY